VDCSETFINKHKRRVRRPEIKVIRPCLIAMGLSALFSLSAPNVSRSQLPAFDPVGEVGDPHFNLDWSQFRSDSLQLTRLEVYYKIANTGLTFIPGENGFEAHYKMSVRVFKDKKQVGYEVFKREKVVDQISRTKLYSDFVLNLVEFDLPPGKYRVVATLEDLNADRNDKKEIKIKLTDFALSKRPKLSGIEFLYSSRLAKTGDKFFRKGDLVVVPLVDRGLQGGDDGGPVLYYFEIYPGADSNDAIIIETQIEHESKGLVYHDSIHVNMDGLQSKELRSVSLQDFVPGTYEIKVSLFTSAKRMKKRKPTFVREDEFSVNWSLLGKVRHDYKTVVAQLEPIATSDEKSALKKAKTTKERVAAWAEFWHGRDPSPGSEENEALLAYYARIRYADTHFSTPRRAGWKSDRGTVFLKQGRPDEVVDEPVSINVGAYQVWYYYNVNGELLRYLFVDEYGDEDFRLQYPYDGRVR
jgi:GWxTD domain-containing protein